MLRIEEIDVSVIIVSFNTRTCLEQCLTAIYSQLPVVSIEVIVVDNASVDGSATMIRERFPQALLMINSENVGFARANNQAMGVARGRFLLLLNSDAIVREQTLERLAGFMNAVPSCGIVGTKLLNADSSFQYSFGRYPSLLGELILATRLHSFWKKGYYPSFPPERSNTIMEVDWVGGACLLARREAVEQIGMLDERFFMYCEEVDWCYRMKKTMNWKVYYLPDAAVIHLGGQSLVGRQGSRRVMVYRSKLLFFRKHFGVFRTMILRCLYIAVSLTKLGILLVPGHSKDDASSYKDIIFRSVEV